MLSHMKSWARSLTRDVLALYLASKDPRVPWHAKALAIFVAGYALSPIDLIPDFIPVLGYIDDMILLPIGIWLVIRMIPPKIMAEHRQAAATLDRPVSRKAAVAIIVIWIVIAALCAGLSYRYFLTSGRPRPLPSTIHTLN